MAKTASRGNTDALRASRTARRPPQYAITRIRSFYMRKVRAACLAPLRRAAEAAARASRQPPALLRCLAEPRPRPAPQVKFTQSVWHEKLAKILEEFPRVDDVHPFYSDLMNVLYDKARLLRTLVSPHSARSDALSRTQDHYKLALGQINTARNLIDKIARDYVKLLKYGDSLYRCKALKRAALGRMCTLMRKHSASLAYLEQVRQHLARLPSIDPSTRTILVCGYPNVGKSSFMNVVTRADVEVQPYAFTTRSLFVGHTDHGYLRWQVIDTPGILDRPLEERNTIEMQSITALAHLRCCVLYVVDISEQCGFSIKQQAALFDSIKPLFSNKPLVVAFNKVDARSLDAVPPADAALLHAMAAAADGVAVDPTAPLLTMSTLNEAGVSAVKAVCCEKLLAVRVEAKLRGKRASAALQRVYVAQPPGGTAAAAASRPPCIPPAVLAARAAAAAGAPAPRRRTEKDEQEAHGGAGVYRADLCKSYLLADDDWRHDIVPEIFDGKNILDFVDPDIEQRLAELEAEEEAAQEAAAAAGGGADAGDEDAFEAALTAEEEALLQEVRVRKAGLVAAHRRAKAAADNAPRMPRAANREGRLTTGAMAEELGAMGVDASAAVARARGRSASRAGRNATLAGVKRVRSAGGAGGEDAEMGEAEGGEAQPPAKRVHSNRSRSHSRGAAARPEASPGEGFRDTPQKNKAQKMADRQQRRRNKMAKAGEADRVILTKMPVRAVICGGCFAACVLTCFAACVRRNICSAASAPTARPTYAPAFRIAAFPLALY